LVCLFFKKKKKKLREKIRKKWSKGKGKKMLDVYFPPLSAVTGRSKGFHLVHSIGEEVKHFFLNTDSSKNLRLRWHGA